VSRAIYENADDRARESEVIKAFSKRFWVDYLSLPVLSVADYIVMHKDGRMLSIVEIKSRTTPKDEYPTYFIGKRKAGDLVVVATKLKLEPVLVVDFSDCSTWVNLRRDPFEEVRPGGRYDRGDTQDEEPMLHIPTEKLRIWRTK